MLRFKVPEFDKAKPGQRMITLEWCYDGPNILGYVQVTPMINGYLELAHKIAALPDLIAVCEELTKEPYSDTDPASLLETLRARAKSVLRLANYPLEPTKETRHVLDNHNS